MKIILCLVSSSLLTMSAFAQSIRLSFKGNRDFQVVVDGKSYTSNNYVNNDLVLTNLLGEHNLKIYRTNKNGKTRPVYSSDVVLAADKEVHLTIHSNGSIERSETTGNAAYGNRSAMSDAAFNNVYLDVNNKWGQAAKMIAARDAFNNSSYHFSSEQVRRIIGLLSAESDRLELAKLAYDNVTDPENYYHTYDLLNSQASRDELANFINNNRYSDPYNGYKVAMTNSNFNQLYRDISSQWSTTERMNRARSAFNSRTNYFSAQQASQIISLLSDENSRLELAKLSVDNIVDQENLNQLFNLLYTQSARDELDRYIRSAGYATGGYSYQYHAAMSDATFNNLYDDIRGNWWPGTKMSASVDAFNTPSNYFTTEQAKKIVGLVSAESNRVELAKLAFDNIVDPQNFRDIYDLFSSQSSRDEVDKYIKVKYNYQ